ncbi:MAG: hypothetical protein LBS30_01875 [Planctomycetota bacterium]|jgi:hypothetical protein|nr:hypothetical protein [Planctomycetota bacterium]
MIELKVFENLAEAIEMCAQMGDLLEPEISKALNRASHGIRTDVTRQLVKTRGINRSEANDWTFKSAQPGDLEALAVIKGGRRGLEKFVNKGDLRRMEGSNNKGGVNFQLAGKTIHLRRAFIHDVYSGELQVRQRKPGARNLPKYSDTGKRLWGRFPLYHLAAVSVPQMADDKDVVDIAVRSIGGRYLSQFDHLVNRLVEEHS